jgi:peptide/nickel transport system substrate-binding protein
LEKKLVDLKLGKNRLAAFAGVVALVSSSLVFQTTASSAASEKVLVIDSQFNHKTLDPQREFEDGGNMMVHTMYDTLLTFKGNDASTPVPNLALSYTSNADSTVYTFKLRKSARFSDGTRLTSADVVYSFGRLKNIQGNPSSLMAGLTATAPDAYTVVITSDQPDTAVPVKVAGPEFGVVNSRVVAAHGGYALAGASTKDTAESYLNTNSAGSGPYMLSKFSLTTEVVLVANPKYWGPKPAYSKIVNRNVTQAVQALDVQKGVANIALDLAPKQVDSLTGVNVTSGVSTTVWFLYSNANPAISAVTSDPNFQNAVRYALNYSALTSFAGRGAIQAAGIIPSAFQGALKPADATKQNIALAKANLAKSAYKGEEIGLRYWGGGAWEGISFDDFATMIASQLAAVGIKLKLMPTPVGDALTTYRNGTDTMGLWFWGPDWPDSSNYSQNFGPGLKVGLRAGWAANAAPEVTKLINQVAIESNPTKRAAQYRQFQLDLNANSPFIPLIQSPATLVSTPTVIGIASNPIWKVNLTELK